jgi:hypothetical protein
MPFHTIVQGVTVSVRKLDVTARGGIVAVCYRGRERLPVPLVALPLPEARRSAGNGSRRTAAGREARSERNHGYELRQRVLPVSHRDLMSVAAAASNTLTTCEMQ